MLGAEDRRKAQRRMVVEGAFSRAMDAVTGGVILAGLAVALGASDAEVGVLAAIPFAAQLAHVPALGLLARARDAKSVTVVAAFVSRFVLLAFAAVPVLALPFSPVAALIVLLATYALVANVAGAGWQVWARGVVPRAELGRYFGRRLVVLSGIGLVSTLLAGWFVAAWRTARPDAPLLGFAILYLVGAAFGLASTFVLSRTPAAPLPRGDPRGLADALRRPLRERNYRRILVFLGAWGFAANFALPFLTVVLLRDYGFRMDVVVGLAALSQVTNVLALRMWGPVTDRFGNKPVLLLSASVFLLATVAWAFLPDARGGGILAAIAAIHALFGLAIAGLDLASTGLVMKVAPDDDAAAYLSSASLVKAVFAGAAPIVAGLVAVAIGAREFVLTASWGSGGVPDLTAVVTVSHYDFLFLISFALGLYAIHRLLGFEEEGEVPPEVVTRALRREVGQLSSAAGMRQFVHVASYVVEAAYRFEKSLTARKP